MSAGILSYRLTIAAVLVRMKRLRTCNLCKKALLHCTYATTIIVIISQDYYYDNCFAEEDM